MKNLKQQNKKKYLNLETKNKIPLSEHPLTRKWGLEEKRNLSKVKMKQ